MLEQETIRLLVSTAIFFAMAVCICMPRPSFTDEEKRKTMLEVLASKSSYPLNFEKILYEIAISIAALSVIRGFLLWGITLNTTFRIEHPDLFRLGVVVSSLSLIGTFHAIYEAMTTQKRLSRLAKEQPWFYFFCQKILFVAILVYTGLLIKL